MANKNILLIEPGYKNKYPPLGLMKIAQYHGPNGKRDRVRFIKGEDRSVLTEAWDRIYVTTLFSFLVLSTPVFVIGTLLKVLWLPVNQAAGTQLLYFNGESTAGFSGTAWETLVDRLQHLVLPTVAIAIGLTAVYSRYQRSAMLDVLGSDFLRTAQAKGLTRRRALFTHGLRTALIPMATLFAFGFGLLITGGVFTERIFGWFGMGDWLIVGVQNQDANIIATVTLFIAVLVLFSGWLSDVLYAALDPRVRVR